MVFHLLNSIMDLCSANGKRIYMYELDQRGEATGPNFVKSMSIEYELIPTQSRVPLPFTIRKPFNIRTCVASPQVVAKTIIKPFERHLAIFHFL